MLFLTDPWLESNISCKKEKLVLNGNPDWDHPHGDQNSSLFASVSIDWHMNEAVTEHVGNDQARL